LGRPIARSDLADRVAASPRLTNVHAIAERFHEELLIARCHEVIAQHAEAEHNRELAREARRRRNHGPRCGAGRELGGRASVRWCWAKTAARTTAACAPGPKLLKGKHASARRSDDVRLLDAEASNRWRPFGEDPAPIDTRSGIRARNGLLVRGAARRERQKLATVLASGRLRGTSLAK
jgi:hypothetical protein